MEAQEAQEASVSEESKVSEVSDFKTKLSPKVLIPLGLVMKIRRRPLSVMYMAGMIHDPLLPIVQKTLSTGRALRPDDTWSTEQLDAIMDLINEIIVQNVEEPKVQPVPQCKKCHVTDMAHAGADHEFEGESRSEDKLYVDDFDDENRTFIYGYVIGAVDDLKSFRSLPSPPVEPVPDGNEVRDEAESAIADKG